MRNMQKMNAQRDGHVSSWDSPSECSSVCSTMSIYPHISTPKPLDRFWWYFRYALCHWRQLQINNFGNKLYFPRALQFILNVRLYRDPVQSRSHLHAHDFSNNNCNIIPHLSIYVNPCGGGVEYLHREPASRKRRRNGTKKGRAIA
jgi:hypothetical protein